MPPQVPVRANALRRLLLNAPVIYERQLMYGCEPNPFVRVLTHLQPQVRLEPAPDATATRFQLRQEFLAIIALV